MKVRAIKEYFDLELEKAVQPLEEFEVSAARAKELAGSENKAHQPLVEIIEDPTPTKKVAKSGTKKKVEDK